MNATLPRLWFDALHANPWFAALSAPERQVLLAEVDVERLPAGAMLFCQSGATQSLDVRPAVSLPQEALAMMLGITRQTLSKKLTALARDGVLKLGYRRIEIVSVAALEAVVHDT